jgi:hypothetical protein
MITRGGGAQRRPAGVRLGGDTADVNLIRQGAAPGGEPASAGCDPDIETEKLGQKGASPFTQY